MAIPTSISEVKRQVKNNKVNSKEEEAKRVEELKPDPSTVKATPFDKGRFGAMLEEVVSEFKQQKKHLECTVLKQPFEVEGHKVTFLLNGELQEHLFNKLKPELVGIVKKKLQNDLVELAFEIREEAVSEEKKLYTSTDKLAYLTKKSPALKELQKRFGLETDF